ncbi:MFS transporter [Magnetospirillum moscoviense]|nr:MFS transporter [Magnetospirillum moscoviense]
MRPVLTLCLAEVLTMLGVFAFPALLPTFSAEWGLTATQAGWIAGIHFAGYAVAVPVLTATTDRIDAKRIYMFGALLAALSCMGFALLPGGFWTGLALRLMGGAGLAGTYMPGLRALVDRTSGPRQTAWISWYTASFSLGTSVSFLAVGVVAELWGWRVAYGMSGLAALAALGLVGLGLSKETPAQASATPGALLDFRPVFANRAVMGYVLAYFAHTWELFALRSWQVAFLTFALAGAATQPSVWASPTAIATWSALAAMAASIWGAGLASRGDRARTCAVAGAASAAMALVIGFMAPLPYPWLVAAMLLYSALVQVDSAALTTGAVLIAEPGRRGATIAVHSLIGFTGGFLGPLAFGLVLDAAGPDRTLAWGLAFACVGLVAGLGPLILWTRRHILATKHD